jgi:hypothetical protein
MPISLTKEQLLDRLSETKRIKLLHLAIVRDAQDIALPVRSEVQRQSNLNLPLEVAILADTYLIRAISLAYEEFLD